MDIQTSFDRDTLQITLDKYARSSKVTLVYHLKVSDPEGYSRWLTETLDQPSAKRLYRIDVDPVRHDGMDIDEVLIDEYTNAHQALDVVCAYYERLKAVCSVHTILFVVPESAAKFALGKLIFATQGMLKKLLGRTPSTAQQQHDLPQLVYSLNKYKVQASECSSSFNVPLTQQQAYSISNRQVYRALRHIGAFPLYAGKPICLLVSEMDDSLVERWDDFFLLHYSSPETVPDFRQKTHSTLQATKGVAAVDREFVMLSSGVR